MKTVVLTIPDTLEMDNNEVAILLSTRLYEQGKLSLGQAADMAGLTKRTFAELLGKYNVSIFNYPASDLSADVDNAKDNHFRDVFFYNRLIRIIEHLKFIWTMKAKIIVLKIQSETIRISCNNFLVK